MSPNGNDPAEPFEEKKDGTVDEAAQTSQNDKDVKKGKTMSCRGLFVSLFGPMPPKTSYPIMESCELAKMDGLVLSALHKIVLLL